MNSKFLIISVIWINLNNNLEEVNPKEFNSRGLQAFLGKQIRENHLVWVVEGDEEQGWCAIQDKER